MKQKKVISIVIIIIISIFTVVFSGCSNMLASTYTLGLTTIEYNNSEYILCPDWEIISENFTTDSLEQDGISLEIKKFNTDKNNEFIECSLSGDLYHNTGFEYPENTSDSIESISLVNINEEAASDKAIISDFAEIIEGSTTKDILTDEYIATVCISYKDYPAVYYYGAVIKDKAGNFLLRHDISEDISEEFYLLDDNSEFTEWIKKFNAVENKDK